MPEITAFHGESLFTLAHLDFVRFRLEMTRRGKRSASVEVWTNILPIAECPTFAQSRRVEDLLPLRLVEVVTSDWGGRRDTWALAFIGAECKEGELVLSFAYSVAASKSWPLERCLMGLGWKQGRKP